MDVQEQELHDGMQTVSETNEVGTLVVLKVSAGSDPRAVGSSIAHSLQEGKTVQLRAVGAGAVNQAVKAGAIASGWTGPRGFAVAFKPGFADVPGREGTPISAITLTVIKV